MRRLIATMVVAVAGSTLAGCVGGGGPTPSPSPVVTPTPVVSPSPTWNDKQHGALDAVYRYLEVSNDIEQHLTEADWNRIREVAMDPAAGDAFRVWNRWKSEGWHVDGTPMFEPDYVNLGMMDKEGDRYHVHGCYDITGTHLVDANGNRQEGERVAERYFVRYVVLLRSTDRKYLVMEDINEEETC